MVNNFVSKFRKKSKQLPLLISPFYGKQWILPQNPTEYTCNPTEIYLGGKEKQYFNINLVPNSPGLFKNFVEIKIEGNELPIYIPLSHNCVIPQIEISPIHFEISCVVGQSNLIEIVVKNLSHVIAFVESFWKVGQNDKTLKVSILPQKEIIPPNTNRTFLVKVMSLIHGNLKSYIHFKVLGKSEETIASIHCITIKPKIIILPKLIKKTLRVLEEYNDLIKLYNPNLIEIKYKVLLLTEYSNEIRLKIQNIHFNKGWFSIEPNTDQSIEIVACFYNKGVFAAEIVVICENGLKYVSKHFLGNIILYYFCI